MAVKTNNPAMNTKAASNMVRVSPGIFRDTSTGKLVRGNQPKANTPANTTTPKTTTPVGAADNGAVRVGSGQWKLADGRVVSSAGRPREGQFGATPAPSVAPTPEAETPYTPTPEMSPEMRNFLFPTTDMANDPVHQNSLKRGEEALNRRLAAGGLMGSGREFELARDMNTELETASQARYNEQRQENAGRLSTMMEGQANRNLTQDQQEWNRILESTRLMLEQNPANFGQSAMTAANGLQGDINAANKANTAGQYQTVRSGGGGVAPVRGTVDNSGVTSAMMEYLKRTGQARNAGDFGNLISGFTSTGGSLLGAKTPEAK
jgi:hypothetical protein